MKMSGTAYTIFKELYYNDLKECNAEIRVTPTQVEKLLLNWEFPQFTIM